MNVSSSPMWMGERANMATWGMGDPEQRTTASSKFPPPQLWLKNRATFPFRVASMLMRRHASRDGSHSLTTCSFQVM